MINTNEVLLQRRPSFSFYRRAPITFKGIPDKRNDQRKSSHLWENRRKFDKKLLGEVRSKNTVNPNYLILQIIKIYYFSLACPPSVWRACPPSFWRDRRIIGCPLFARSLANLSKNSFLWHRCVMCHT